jgi:hypothetical protein
LSPRLVFSIFRGRCARCGSSSTVRITSKSFGCPAPCTFSVLPNSFLVQYPRPGRGIRSLPQTLPSATAEMPSSGASPSQAESSVVRASRKRLTSWVHAHLWTIEEERQIPCATQNHAKATSHKAERAKGGASTTLARISGGTREMVEARCTGLLQLSCCAREYRQSEKFSARSDAALAAGTPSSWSEASDDVGPPPACGRPLASHSQNPSSVSELAL